MSEDDTTQCLLRTHDDAVELLQQSVLPAVIDILFHLLQESMDVTDSHRALLKTFCTSLNNIAGWSFMSVSTVAKPYAHLKIKMMTYLTTITEVKARMLQKNGLLPMHAQLGSITMNLEFSFCLHTILVHCAGAVMTEIDTILSDTEDMARIRVKMIRVIRDRREVEHAVLQLIQDTLNDLANDTRPQGQQQQQPPLQQQHHSPVHVEHTIMVNDEGAALSEEMLHKLQSF
jgi:hypothetical protein